MHDTLYDAILAYNVKNPCSRKNGFEPAHQALAMAMAKSVENRGGEPDAVRTNLVQNKAHKALAGAVTLMQKVDYRHAELFKTCYEELMANA
jgi:hypothetical protein